jgi:hypothetical protein
MINLDGSSDSATQNYNKVKPKAAYSYAKDDEYSEYDNSKEITSLLSTNAKAYNNHNVAESIHNMKKRDIKNESISSEQPKSFLQRYIFDLQKYDVYFETTTVEIKNNVIDALWPFFPENQSFLHENG